MVELLVVIAIIAILAALMMASLPPALESARKTQCLGRLSNLGRALLLYELDNDLTFPGAGKPPTGVPQTSVAYTYTRDILPYLGLTEEQAKQSRNFFCCPSRSAETNGTFASSHYLFSGANNIAPAYLGLAGVRSTSILEPARTVLAGEGAAAIPFSNHPFRGKQVQPDAKCWLFFVDGHAAFLRIHSPGEGLTAVKDPPSYYSYQWSPGQGPLWRSSLIRDQAAKQSVKYRAPGKQSDKLTRRKSIVMPKYIVTHTLPPKGFSRDQFCQVAVATQQDPIVKCHQSFANLTEGKVFCYWDSPEPEALIAWFKKMNVPYDSIIKLEHIADKAGVQDV